MDRSARTALAALLAIGALAGAAGCGLGAGRGTGNVTLTVTRSFGNRKVATVERSGVPGSETVMRMLERSFRVQTRYGGGFVESINGLSGTSARRDWFYYVNGIQAPVGAASTAVHRGDRIWWDLHDWSATESIPAVVGSFPEPFVHGIGGKRLPTTLECASDVGTACSMVSSALGKEGVPVATQLLGTGSGSDTLSVVVGTWKELRPELAASLIEHGPAVSGVYARFSANAANLQLLDPAGRVALTLGQGTGLIAATADHSSEPIWMITGTDAKGVTGAASALAPSRLRDHFALAIHAGSTLSLPLDGAT